MILLSLKKFLILFQLIFFSLVLLKIKNIRQLQIELDRLTNIEDNYDQHLAEKINIKKLKKEMRKYEGKITSISFEYGELKKFELQISWENFKKYLKNNFNLKFDSLYLTKRNGVCIIEIKI